MENKQRRKTKNASTKTSVYKKYLSMMLKQSCFCVAILSSLYICKNTDICNLPTMSETLKSKLNCDIELNEVIKYVDNFINNISKYLPVNFNKTQYLDSKDSYEDTEFNSTDELFDTSQQSNVI